MIAVEINTENVWKLFIIKNVLILSLMSDNKLIASQCMIWKKSMVYLDHKINVLCIFCSNKQTNKHVLYVSFIKDFKVMKIWEKRGPKSDFLTWFYCFSVNTENV